ncbi:hypothetical protein K474DRAFT_1655619 [Panus rudis PR-1116 ss-1]|nr:hypothetical protein K474DRAFT_1655619 [Panus rudis PR-1116 ss-1]
MADSIPGFQRRGQDVYVDEVYVDEAIPHAGPSDGPRHVIIFAWMGAQLPHIRKYADQYRAFFPRANRVLVLSRPEHFYAGARSREASVAPLVQYLKEHGVTEGNTSGGVLVHVFSNGGANQLIELHEYIAPKVPEQPTKAQPICFVFDSVPGIATLSSALEAFTAQIQSRLLKLMAYIFFFGVYVFLTISYAITGTEPLIDRARRVLNKVDLFPGATVKTPRLYLYSDKDKLVPAHAVESHIDQARQLGLNVKVEKFTGSAHVQHARVHPDAYWHAVKSAWEEAKHLAAQ